MKISIVSDEISKDFSTAVELAVDWGIRNFEIRELAAGRIPNIHPEFYENMLHTIENYKINITAISPGCFKGLFEKELIEKEIKEDLPKYIQCAKDVKTDKIIIFGFRKPVEIPHKNYPKEIIDVYNRMVEIVSKENITLMIENEPHHWIGEPYSTAEILGKVNSKYLRLNWDPTNAFLGDGKILVKEYEILKDFIVNVHVKDAKMIDCKLKCVFLGKGEIDWIGILKALVNNSYNGYLAIETHLYGQKVKESKICYETLKNMLENLR